MSWVKSFIRAHFLSLAQSKLRVCSANHRPGYWCNLSCDWPSTAWAHSEQATENGPWSHNSPLSKLESLHPYLERQSKSGLSQHVQNLSYLQSLGHSGSLPDNQWSWYHWRGLLRSLHRESDPVQPAWFDALPHMSVYQNGTQYLNVENIVAFTENILCIKVIQHEIFCLMSIELTGPGLNCQHFTVHIFRSHCMLKNSESLFYTLWNLWKTRQIWGIW